MSDVVIRAEGLGKQYVIGHESERYVALRDVLARGARSVWRKTADMIKSRAIVPGDTTEEFWALRDVSFEVKQGEVLGVIGRNGAGKSTLLKILSRITEPSDGRVIIKGRVASLLEVGTGFHPELTGRENIYLNGAILGMTRAEIKRKFDEIVAFAEIEKFLDTPVKRYSSGMYVRLAFAVAAHLEPDVLLVDEVLAVGDAEFQKKCLGKMGDVAGEGRTVLFVSHNMNMVERLCQRILWLERGKVSGVFNDVREGILKSLEAIHSKNHVTCLWRDANGVPSNNYFMPEEFVVTSGNPRAAMGEPFSNRFDIIVDIIGEIFMSDPTLSIGIALYDEGGSLLFWSLITDTDHSEFAPGPVHLRVRIPNRFLNEGKYRLELLAGLLNRAWLFEPGRNAPMISFSIQGGLSDSPYWHIKRPGILAPELLWERREEMKIESPLRVVKV